MDGAAGVADADGIGADADGVVAVQAASSTARPTSGRRR
jgi:hypothetical protein